MNRAQRRKLKRSANIKILGLTFVGAFIIFFIVFSYILPVVTPEVEIPALSEEHVFNAINSNDFRGKIDPRLHSIELQERINKDKQKAEEEKKAKLKKQELAKQKELIKSPPDKPIQPNKYKQVSPVAVPLPTSPAYSSNQAVVQAPVPPIAQPPRPMLKPSAVKQKVNIVPPAPIFKARVIVGDFSSPKEARLTSDILSNLSYKPFIRERNGKYIIQLESFSDTKEANNLVQELKTRNFDARIIYE